MIYSDFSAQERLSSVMYRVYGWMCAALAITAGVAYYIYQSPEIFDTIFVKNPSLVIALVIVQLGIVLSIAFLLHRMNFITALVLFVLYAVSVGVTLSSIFYEYSPSSIFVAFTVTAGMFGAMCVYGYVTKSDLTAMGNLMIMLLFGLILAMIVNLWVQSNALAYWISAIGVFIFTLLTAYDTQKIKEMAARYSGDREAANKIAVFGALTLYLDFINLFLSLLQFMNNRRD